MYLVNVDLALLDLPLKLLINFILVNDTPKSLLNLLASLHDLPLNQLVIHSAALRELHQNRVLFVHSMELPVLNIKEGPLPLAVGALSLPKAPLLQVNDLPQMENVLNPSLYGSDEFLRILDLLISRLNCG